MDEREKVCILCGAKEVMTGYICTACQERIQQEAVDQREKMLRSTGFNGAVPDTSSSKG